MDPKALTQALIVRVALIVCGCLTAVTLVLAVFGDKGVLEVQERHEQLERFEFQLDAIQRENASFLEEIDDLRRDPAAIEQLAREELKLVRPGEVVLILPADAPKDRPSIP